MTPAQLISGMVVATAVTAALGTEGCRRCGPSATMAESPPVGAEDPESWIAGT